MKTFHATVNISVFAVLLLAVACGDDEIFTGPSPKGPVDVQLRLSGMGINVGHVLHVNVIASDQRLKSRAIIEPLRSAADTVTLPLAAPFSGHRIDMYADVNNSRAYEPPPNDHSWRVNVPPNGVVTFARDNNFTDITDSLVIRPGAQFRLSLSGFDEHIGRRFEARVIDISNGRAVGLYRIDGLNAGVRSMSIDGVIVSGAVYQVDFYADLNGNKRYDAPPVDRAWRVMASGGASGLTVIFPLDSNYTDVGF